MPKSINKVLRDYISPIGIKIVVPLCALMLSATIFNLYRQGGWEWVYSHATDPVFWIVPLLTLFVIVIILSKVVILPLKKFELHIKGLKSGETSGPFKLDTKDELGFLTDRFNNLQTIINERIEVRDRQFDVLHTFMDAASGVFDTKELMATFFETLSTTMDFEMGAYAIVNGSRADGAILCGDSGVSDKRVDEISAALFSKVAAICPDYDNRDGSV
ncbi:MAG: hypothetical protein V3T30_03955, partial [Thermodesulfobacteriota bacterium]